MRYGLSEENISKIQNIFIKYSEIKDAILYGSRAKGNFKPGSDIDIVLVGEFLNHRILNSIRNDLDELNLPYTFDLSIWSEIDNSDLLSHIQRVGKTF